MDRKKRSRSDRSGRYPSDGDRDKWSRDEEWSSKDDRQSDDSLSPKRDDDRESDRKNYDYKDVDYRSGPGYRRDSRSSRNGGSEERDDNTEEYGYEAKDGNRYHPDGGYHDQDYRGSHSEDSQPSSVIIQRNLPLSLSRSELFQCKEEQGEEEEGENRREGEEGLDTVEGDAEGEESMVQVTELLDTSAEAVSNQPFSATKPNQPDPKFIVKQSVGKYILKFQTQWYNRFPWLHFSPGVEGVLCFYCCKAFHTDPSTLAKTAEPAFISAGFKSWRKAIERFSLHENSDCHQAVITTHLYEDRLIQYQLASVSAAQQEEARACLLKIIGAVQLLARQGLALRGHDSSEGNLDQLLKYKAEEDPCLAGWLSNKKDVYTSGTIQNEFLNLISTSIVREIAYKIRSLPYFQFSIMMDGTRDQSGKEQEALCFRYVDHDLVVHEEFIGLYEISLTTGDNLARVVKDVLLRLNLPITGLRGQAYDGPANTAGKYSEAQAIIQREQPLALYVHCGAHCVNGITQQACTASAAIRNPLEWVHELRILFGQSGKLKDIFKRIAKTGEGPQQAIRPLCPTRWTICTSAIRAVLNQYEHVLLALSEMATGNSDAAGRAQCLYDTFQQGNVVLGLLLALEVTEELETLNVSLQRRTQTIGGMLYAVACVKDTFVKKRNSDSFQTVHTKASQMCETLGLTPIASPRVHKPPQRFTGCAPPAHVHASPSEYFRTEFYKVLDVVDMQIRERFEQEGMRMISNLEQVLLTGEVHDVVQRYPELDPDCLKTQLAIFRIKYDFKSSSDVVGILQGMCPEVRGRFDQVETLVRLLIVVPVLSAEVDTGFSGLRRLKTWLRSTMTQSRLNSVAVCHIHKEKLDMLDREAIAKEFVSRKDNRRSTFGCFEQM